MEPANNEKEKIIDMIEVDNMENTYRTEEGFRAEESNRSREYYDTQAKNSTRGLERDASKTTEKIKYRRVGTITMGVSLILTGIIVICALFKKDFDIMLAVKCVPVVLIALGVEILVQYFCAKSGKIKYDFLSVLVCGVLIFGSLGFAAVSPFLTYLSPERQAKEMQIQKEFEEEVHARLSGISSVEDVYTSMGLNFTFPDGVTLETADTYCDYANITVKVNIPESKEEFASYVSEIRDALANLSIKDTNIHVSVSYTHLTLPTICSV